VRTRVLKFDDVSPLSNSFAELRRAANALYDLASGWLQHRSQRQERWSIEVPSFRHRDVVSGAFRLLPGDRTLLRYRGVATSMDGHRRLWADINEMAWCRALERTFTADGDDRWQLEMASSLNIVDDDSVLAETVENMWAMQVSPKHSLIETQAGPFFDSIDNGFPVTLNVTYDSDIRYLHRAKLSIERYPIRADAKGAASGGGQTTSSGGATTQTTTSGGSTTQTSSGGSSHSHTFTGQTTGIQLQAHRHLLGQAFQFGFGVGTNWQDPPFAQMHQMTQEDGTAYGYIVGRSNTNPGARNFWTVGEGQSHQHNLSGVTSNSESSHTHSVSIPNHQHSVSIPNHTHNVSAHTHPLDYGIYQGSLPSNPGFQVWINGVNRTSALGGPWNSNQFELDITPYLVDSQGYVRQQKNRVQIRANNLQRIEVSCRSVVTMATSIPV
jgi:hypothetical protein